jgi:hypothetical protein
MGLGFQRRASVLAAGWLVALASFACDVSVASPLAPLQLGDGAAFAVLGASTVTSAGVSTVTGDLGVSPGTAVTGFPPGILVGSMHAGDGPAARAHADLATAYGDGAGRSPAVPEAGPLDGLTLGPGVYATGAGMSLAGTLKLDAGGNTNAVFIFQAGSTLITAADSKVVLVGGAQACNVFWQVGSSATLGATSLLSGSILASASISMGDGVTVNGRALAVTAAVTMINDTVTAPACAGSLANTAPAIAPFSARLTGLTRTLHTAVGGWSVTDATGSNAGYSVTVTATGPTVNGSMSAAGTGGHLTLTPVSGTAASGNLAASGPLAMSAQTLGTTAATIVNAAAGTGQGEWDFAGDSGITQNLAVVIPGDASVGAYSSTLTFTTAPPVA